MTPSPTLADYGYDTDFLGTPDTDAADTEVVTPPENLGPSVLILDDGAAGTQVADGLRERGLSIIEGPTYDTWDGSNPGLDGVSVVIVLQGSTFMPRMPSAGDRALRDFVGEGGGLIRTERAVASLSTATPMGIDEVLPVEFLDEVADGEDWWVDERDHPIADSVPARWTEAGGFSLVAVAESATSVAQVIISTDARVPLLTVREDLPGRIVHINHDLTATSETMGSEILDLFGAAASWASR